MKKSNLALIIVASFSLTTQASPVTSAIDEAIEGTNFGLSASAPLHRMSEEGVDLWHFSNIAAKKVSKAGHSVEQQVGSELQVAVLNTNNYGRNAIVDSVAAEADGGLRHVRFQIAESGNLPSDIQIKNLVSNRSLNLVTTTRKFSTNSGHIETETTYEVRNLTKTPTTLRDQDKFLVRSENFVGTMDKDLNRDSLNIQTALIKDGKEELNYSVHIKTTYPEGEVCAFKMDGLGGKGTIYTTKGEGGKVYSRTLRLYKSGSSIDSSNIEVGTPKPLTAEEVVSLGVFSVESKTIASRAASRSPVAGMQVNESSAGHQ